MDVLGTPTSSVRSAWISCDCWHTVFLGSQDLPYTDFSLRCQQPQRRGCGEARTAPGCDWNGEHPGAAATGADAGCKTDQNSIGWQYNSPFGGVTIQDGGNISLDKECGIRWPQCSYPCSQIPGFMLFWVGSCLTYCMFLG